MMTDSENAGCRPEFSSNLRIDSSNSWVREARSSTNKATLFFTSPHYSTDRMNQVNIAHSPTIYASFPDMNNVTEHGVAVFLNLSAHSNPYIDLLSHWNGAMPSTDGLLLDLADFAILVRVLFPQLPVKGLQESVLSIGRDQYEHLELRVASSDGVSLTVHASWTHNTTAHVTSLQTQKVTPFLWHTIELVVRGAFYINSTVSNTSYSLYVDKQLVDQQVRQSPPKLVIPTAAVVGARPCGTTLCDHFRGLIARVEVLPSNTSDLYILNDTPPSVPPPSTTRGSRE